MLEAGGERIQKCLSYIEKGNILMAIYLSIYLSVSIICSFTCLNSFHRDADTETHEGGAGR